MPARGNGPVHVILALHVRRGAFRVKLRVGAWKQAQAAHEERADDLTRAHSERKARGKKHAVEDFMFSYYRLSVGKLREWHPGHGATLLGSYEDLGEFRSPALYRNTPAGLTLNSTPLIAKRQSTINYALNLLQRTASRPAQFGFLGLHEWAMVYRLKDGDQRHTQHPLRLGHDGTVAVVEAGNWVGTHLDAFRLFTPEAVPRNREKLSRESRPEKHQPGCLHANMDLYRWYSKLLPLVPSELVLDTFELARDIRRLDMAASPYDPASIGTNLIKIETAPGRKEYLRQQRFFAERSTSLRAALLRHVRELHYGANGHESTLPVRQFATHQAPEMISNDNPTVCQSLKRPPQENNEPKCCTPRKLSTTCRRLHALVRSSETRTD